MNIPFHRHDCEQCEFLGTVECEGAVGGVADLYVCYDQPMGPTYIARKGEDGEYSSCPEFLLYTTTNPLLREAYSRAQARPIKRFGGTISKRGERIEGTDRMEAYQDVWEEARPINYDGELTPEVCRAIEKAWKAYNDSLPNGYTVALRWPSPDRFVRVDVERRAVIVSCAINLCD